MTLGVDRTVTHLCPVCRVLWSYDWPVEYPYDEDDFRLDVVCPQCEQGAEGEEEEDGR